MNRIDGTSAADDLYGTAGSDNIKSGDGDDWIRAAGGNDTAVGGDGDDTIDGGDGDDQIWAGADDTGNDMFDGDAGNDILGGGAGDDYITGGEGRDILFGGAGNDTLIGGYWIDRDHDDVPSAGDAYVDTKSIEIIWGGDGNDRILSGHNNDTLGGGEGNDSIFAGDGDDKIYGGKETDTDAAINDIIEAGGGNDLVFGGAGNDRIAGEGGDDDLYSGQGDDTVSGGDGMDTLWGGPGDDYFIGGDGGDIFSLGGAFGNDTIADFDISGDKLVLNGIGLDELTTSYKNGNTILSLEGGRSITLLDINYDPNQPQTAAAPAAATATSLQSPGARPTGTVLTDPLSIADKPTISANETYIKTGDEHLYVSFEVPDQVTNHGTLWLVNTSGTMPLMEFTNGYQFTNTGTMVVESDTGHARLLKINSHGAIDNDGTMIATSRAGYVASAIYSWGGHLNNSGLIQADAIYARAVILSEPRTIDNSGTILAVGVEEAVAVRADGEANLTNSGVIEARASQEDSVAILMLGRGSVENTGTVKGDYAIVAHEQSFSVTNNGIISGKTLMSIASDSILNTGSWTGDIYLLDGNDTFNSTTGRLAGIVDGGRGNDIITGSGRGDSLYGGSGNDRLYGNDGRDLLIGGAGDDSLYGDGGADGLSGGFGDDLMVLGKGDVALGSLGDDIFRVYDSSFKLADGGEGQDSLEIHGASNAFLLADFLGEGRLTSIETISLQDGAKVAINEATAAALGLTHIVGDSGTAALYGGWQKQASDMAGYNLYTQNGTALYVAKGIRVTLPTDAPNGYAGPAATGSESAPHVEEPAAYILNSDEQVTDGTFEVHEGVTYEWTNQTIGLSLYGLYGEPRLENSGTILNTTRGEEHIYALHSQYGEEITNYGEVAAIAVDGWATGAFLSGAEDELTNHGSIRASSVNGGALGVDSYDLYFVNTGTIEAVSENASAKAVTMHNPNHATDPIVNSGTITATGSDQATGILVAYFNVIENSGTITAEATAPDGTAIGIHASYLGAEIVNTGTIAADTAIQVARALTLTNSGDIHGNIINERGYIIMTNSGRIEGFVSTGDQGMSTIINRTGVITGWVTTGDDHDLLIGGAGRDKVDGGLGNDGIYTHGGNDLIVVEGGDIVEAGNGHDTITVKDLHFQSISGGSGFDHVEFSGGQKVSLTSILDKSLVSGIEAFTLTDGSALSLSAEAYVGANGFNETRILGASSNEVALIGDWKLDGSVTLSGTQYDRYVTGTKTLLVSADITTKISSVEPDGFISHTDAEELDFSRHEDQAPEPDILPQRLSDNENFTVEANQLAGGLTLHSWQLANNSTLTNYGRIAHNLFNEFSMRVMQFTHDSSFVNHGTMEFLGYASSPNRAWATGIHMQGGGTLLNYGTISITTLDGSAVAFQSNNFNGNEITFENYGLIEAIGEGTLAAEVETVSTLINQGTLSAEAAGNYNGGALALSVQFFDAIENSGTIRAVANNEASSAIGLRLKYAQRAYDPDVAHGSHVVTNTGTIEGNTAIEIRTQEVTIDNQGDILGDILYLTYSGDGTGVYIRNSGTIDGDIVLGTRRDVYEHIVDAEATGVIDAGAGDDRLIISTSRDRSGTLEDFGLAGATNFEFLELAGRGDIDLTLSESDVQALTDEDDILYLLLDRSDSVDLQGDWVSGGTITIDGIDYAQWTLADTTVYIGDLS